MTPRTTEIDVSILDRLARSEMKRLIDMYVLLHRAQILKRESAAACGAKGEGSA